MDYFCSWCKSEKRLDGVTAIVTGCNTGIGKETVRDFYIRGAHVIMACRNLGTAEAAKNDITAEIQRDKSHESAKGSLKVQKLDLTSLKSVREFVSKVLEEEQSIQILVNNAGVMMCVQGTTEDGFETQMGTNHLGHALLTLLLMPRLKRSAPSRIVSVSSYAHRVFPIDLNDMNLEVTPYEPLMAYSRSKAANILFSAALAKKLQDRNINTVTTYSLHPGVIATDIGRHFSASVWLGATWLFQNVCRWFVRSPRCGAQTTIYCALDDACAKESGRYYRAKTDIRIKKDFRFFFTIGNLATANQMLGRAVGNLLGNLAHYKTAGGGLLLYFDYKTVTFVF